MGLLLVAANCLAVPGGCDSLSERPAPDYRMSCYYVQALVGGDAVGLYVEAPDFDSAWDAAENKVDKSYPRKESVVQALQLISEDPS